MMTKTQNFKKIKELIINYESAYNDYGYAGYMIDKVNGKKKQQYEEDMDFAEGVMDDIAEQIKELNPSKYMLNKYPEIQDILETL